MDDSEQGLIQKCQQGQLEHFSALYESYFDKIYRFLYYRTFHKETAEDLTSQTFFKALRNINQFGKGKYNFSAWLYAIARNCLIDYYRAKKTVVAVEDFWGLAAGGDLEGDLINQERLKKARRLLMKLKPEQRDIIVMRIWDELPYKEISAIMGKSEAACKMIFVRAMDGLKQEGLTLAILFLIQRIQF